MSQRALAPPPGDGFASWEHLVFTSLTTSAGTREPLKGGKLLCWTNSRFWIKFVIKFDCESFPAFFSFNKKLEGLEIYGWTKCENWDNETSLVWLAEPLSLFDWPHCISTNIFPLSLLWLNNNKNKRWAFTQTFKKISALFISLKLHCVNFPSTKWIFIHLPTNSGKCFQQRNKQWCQLLKVGSKGGRTNFKVLVWSSLASYEHLLSAESTLTRMKKGKWKKKEALNEEILLDRRQKKTK